MLWRLVGARNLVRFVDDDAARDWLDWGLQHASGADATEWANVAGNMRRSRRFVEAQQALAHALSLGASSRASDERGTLLDAMGGDLSEAETAYRKAIELDPDNSWTWNNLGILLDAQDRLDEAAVAYSRGATLGAEVYPYWRKRRCELMTRRYTSAARRALDAGDLPALREALGRLLAGADGIATILVSEDFVEGFLALVLAGRHGADLLAVLRELGFEKHARPLLLAVEAAIENRADKLAELEPEIRAAAQQMFERLSRASDRC
jgi:tetratricopeptide (TPR) repeat protein